MSTSSRVVRRTHRIFYEHNGSGPWDCYDCGKTVECIGRGTWDGNIHHLDHDKSNDAPENLVVMHAICHQHQHPVTDELKDQISRKLKGRVSPTKGMTFPDHWTKNHGGLLNRSRPSRRIERTPTQSKRRSSTPKTSSRSKRTSVVGEENPFFGRRHTEATRAKMSTPRARLTCSDCGEDFAVNWIERHKKGGECRARRVIKIAGVSRVRGKLPKFICPDCGKPFAQRWMERHKKEGRCTVPRM